MIFFDHNSTAPLNKEVLAKMISVYSLPLNSSAIHKFGGKANFFISEAKENLQKLLNAKNYEIIFTSGATEATNTAFFGTEIDNLLFSQIEHNSVFSCRPKNKKIIEIAAEKNGKISLDDLDRKISEIDSGNFLLSLMYANNETGVIQPVFEASKMVHQKGGLFHCDIVQAVGKIPVDLEAINADFASISAHKFGGPQGVGALLFRKGLQISSFILGSKQQNGLRAGTMNIAGIAGFGQACEVEMKQEGNFDKIRELRDYLEESLFRIAGEDIMIFCKDQPRLANTSLISLKNSDSQIQVMNFDINGICLSAGSACSSGQINESRILRSMGIDKEFLRGAIRISLGRSSTIEEVKKFLEIWKNFYFRSKNLKTDFEPKISLS